MILMIFVNDLWSLKDIPRWLEHVDSGVDGIGLADTIFPSLPIHRWARFSIPFSIENRRAKGDTNGQLLQHVLIRTIALLVMGVFFVNGEEINEIASGLPRHWYNTLCCLSFILIWNIYPKTGNKNWIFGWQRSCQDIDLSSFGFHLSRWRNRNLLLSKVVGNFRVNWLGFMVLVDW